MITASPPSTVNASRYLSHLTLTRRVDAILADTSTLGAASIVVTSPVAQDGTITVYRGNDYTVGEIRLSITTSLDLDGATVSFLDEYLFEKELTYVSDDDGTWLFDLLLTDTETSAMNAGVRGFEVEAVLASGVVKDLAQGRFIVQQSL